MTVTMDTVPTRVDEAFARSLDALATPSRLALIRELRAPKTLREIRVGAGGGDESRTLSRQAVKEHLERLMEVGVVLARETERDYGPTTEYSLNHQTIYALSEEFRALAKLRPSMEPQARTLHAAAVGSPASSPADAPALVLVKGLDEGRRFEMPPAAGGASRRWIIGRRRGLDVSLDFDPYVSSEQALVTWNGKAHVLSGLPESRNATLLNFVELAPGEQRELRPGDIIGVGRSLLVYRR